METIVSEVSEALKGRWSKLEKKPKPPPPDPRVLEPEHEVSLDDLPRGPKAVANSCGGGWRTRWSRVVSEELDGPKRGGECFGLRFDHPDGRGGWASWARGKYEGAFLYRPVDREDPSTFLVQRPPEGRARLIRVPVRLSASELKKELADGGS